MRCQSLPSYSWKIPKPTTKEAFSEKMNLSSQKTNPLFHFVRQIGIPNHRQVGNSLFLLLFFPFIFSLSVFLFVCFLAWAATCREGTGTPLQYSCLENPMDGGAWWAAVHGVAKSQTRPSNFPFTFHFHALEKEMATHSSVLAWRIPGTGEPGGLLFMGSHRVGHDWSDLAAAVAYHQRVNKSTD